MQHPQVTDLRGHSLGSSAALELQKNYPNHIKSTRSYGGPIWDPLGKDGYGKVNRFRNITDPVSMFDRSATVSVKLNPLAGGTSLNHDYSNIADKFNSPKRIPISSENADKSISLIAN